MAWINVSSTLQKETVGSVTNYRFNLGSAGFFNLSADQAAAILVETNARTTAEAIIVANINAEITRAIDTENDIEDSVVNEANLRAAQDVVLQDNINKLVPFWVSFTATAGQTVFQNDLLKTRIAFQAIQGGSTFYTNKVSNLASDTAKTFAFDLDTGTATMPVGLSDGETLEIGVRSSGNPAFIPDSVVKQSDFDAILNQSINVTGVTTREYYDKDTGVRTDYFPVTFVSNSPIKCSPTDTFRRLGFAFTTANQATGIVFYDSVGAYLGNAGIIPADYSFVVGDLYPTADTVAFCSTSGAGLTVYRSVALSLPNLQAQIDINASDISLIVETRDGFTDSGVLNGFTTSSGGFTASANWRQTPLIEVEEGGQLRYTGNCPTSNSAYPLFGYDENGLAVTSLLPRGNYNNELVIVPTGIGIKSVKACSRAISGDVYKLIYKKLKISGGGGGEVVPDVKAHVAKKAYAIQGTALKINPYGQIALHPDGNTDVFFNIQQGNEKCLSYTAGAEASQDVILKVRDAYGVIKDVGTTSIQVTHTTQSPAISQNIIHMGDSTVYGQGTSPLVQGAIVNELSRRLTGVGTALMSGSQSPTALALTNIKFIGTLGNQPIKHEGRSGWSNHDYLNATNLSGNAFWNTSLPGFDLGYYLSHNNFNADQVTGGVDATGSNLTILHQCTWNNVYNDSITTAVAEMKLLLDKIHAQKSGAKVVLVGISGPAYPNKKDFTGARNVSVESIMREAVINYSNAWQGIADDSAYSSFVTFLPTAPFFFPLNSYASVDETLTIRDTNTTRFYLDYVHCNAQGYAQFADNLFNYLIWKLCKAT